MDAAAKYDLNTLLDTYTMHKVLADYYPCGWFGNSKDGLPVLYEAYGRIDWRGLVHSVSRDEIVKSRLYNGQVTLKKCREQSEKLGKDVNQAILIYDLEGLGTKHLWKPGIDVFKQILTAFEECYPTIFKNVIIIKAPKIFPVVYSLAKAVLSEETKQKVVVCGGNWANDLQKYIDPSEIPEYYGGLARDENDDPMCKAKICYGGEVPTSLYVSNDYMLTSDEFQQVTVSAGSVFSVEKEITTVGSVISWKYSTVDHDIGFSVDFKEKSDNGTKANAINVVPFDKKTSQFVPDEGAITCDKVGCYVVNFDNSYSWTRSKKLSFQIMVSLP